MYENEKAKIYFFIKITEYLCFQCTLHAVNPRTCKNDINATYAYIVELIKPKGDETCLPVSLY